ncbi:AraC-type DNA-binding protein [Thermomonospora echinospora]|uniref:AraC-type DNA-binding protein n=1 Tax=Thermomonospora echinospora TaxID=1992 RepID=A0A1H6D9Q0_9ACTN|nr:AraC family transcriptional regulator [Thermomonospora echinospora]SEG81918.1 AraC-type DNA-binding protein [Thermomonospora echinospora]
MTGFAQPAASPPPAANARLVTLRGRSGVAAGSYRYEGDAVDLSWHRHDLHQLEYAFEGIVEVETAVARYRLPSRQAVWIPAGLAHKSGFVKARTVSVFFDPVLVRDTAGRARVLPVEPVFREMIIYAARWPIGRPASDQAADSYFEALAHLVVEALDQERPFYLPTSTDPLVTAAMRYTDAHLDEVSLTDVCRAIAVSERTLRRRFHTATGMAWRQYLLHSRLLHAMTLLSHGDRTVLGVATAVGFDSASAFSRAFQAYTGQTPTAFRQERRRPPRLD